MPIGNNIRILLDQRREKILTFSRNLGISYTTAFDLYHASTKAVSFELLDKLCQYFQVTSGEISPMPRMRVTLQIWYVNSRKTRAA